MWSVNIIVRSLLYVAKTYQDYFTQSKQSLYSTRKVKMPKPELYVLYTGKAPVDKEYITLSEEFFGGQESALDVKVKVITGGRSGDIIDQYVRFTEVSDEQIKLHGRTRETAADIVRICKDRDILKNYLTSREGEVTDMLTTLYDQDEVLELFIASERREAAEEAAEKAKAEAEKKAKEAAEEAKAEAEKKAKEAAEEAKAEAEKKAKEAAEEAKAEAEKKAKEAAEEAKAEAEKTTEKKVKETAKETAKQAAKQFYANHVPIEIIAKSLEVDVETVESWVS